MLEESKRIRLDATKSPAEWLEDYMLYLDEQLRVLQEKVLTVHRSRYHAVDDLQLQMSEDYNTLTNQIAQLRAEFAELRLPKDC